MEKERLDEILKQHALWVETVGKKGIQADLSDADLRGIDLGRVNLGWANLTRCNLCGADLSDANLSGAQLNEANLSRSNLKDANLSSANLSGADMGWAGLEGCNLIEARLTRANLIGADLRKADFGWGDLTRAKLIGAKLNGANLSEAKLTGANLSGADLNGAQLHGVKLNGAILTEAKLVEAKLDNADLRGADFGWATLTGADLNFAKLTEANLSGANLKEVKLTCADLSFANLRGTDFSGSNLSGAKLSNAKLRETDLRWVNLSGADLSCIDLRRANIEGANLEKAITQESDAGKAGIKQAALSGEGQSSAAFALRKVRGLFNKCSSFIGLNAGKADRKQPDPHRGDLKKAGSTGNFPDETDDREVEFINFSTKQDGFMGGGAPENNPEELIPAGPSLTLLEINLPQPEISLSVIDNIKNAAGSVMGEMGYEPHSAEHPVRGSFFQKIWFTLKLTVSVEEAQKLACDAKEALRSELTEKKIRKDENYLPCASELIKNLEYVSHAAIRFGNIVLIKKIENGTSLIVVENISDTVMAKLEINPLFLRNPLAVFDIFEQEEI